MSYLSEETTQLGEVVVTALGVERSQKALQSSVTKVPGVSLTSARENNFGASIQGRVAGVNVSKARYRSSRFVTCNYPW